MDKSLNRKLFVCMSVVVVTVLLMVSIAWFNSIHCRLEQVKPKRELDLSQVKLLKSDDNKNLIRFVGYVKYEKDSRFDNSQVGFLPLDWTTIKYNDGGKAASNLILSSECAMLKGKVKKVQQNKGQWIIIDELRVHLTLANGEFYDCSIEVGDLSYQLGKHYLCQSDKSYLCTVRSEDEFGAKLLVPVVTLVINHLQLELNGQTSDIADGNFSSEPYYCD